MAGLQPQIPSSLQIYNSYVEDPIWQSKFTIVWCSALGVVITGSLPIFVRSVRNGRVLKGFFGVSEDIHKSGYTIMPFDHRLPPHSSRKVTRVWHSITSIRHWTLPWMGLDIAQVLLVLAYLGTMLYCIIKDAPLLSNPNRAGFLALAQFPIVFLFATKNSILSLLFGPGNGYERLNYIHRAAGRFMFLAAGIHGSLWIRNHLQYGLPILGPQKETSGVAALSVLGIILLSSLRPVRRLFYGAFFVVHFLTFVAFFVTVTYHTPFATPWIFPPLALYATDIFLRFIRYRIKDAKLVARDEFITMVQINHCDDGWLAGQHVRLRVFFTNRMFESHPFTIMSAPPAQSCLTTSGMLLAARVNGDWTRALNDFTRKEQDRLQLSEKDLDDNGVPVYVVIDGPYGGSSVDLGQHETVLLVAGGSGVTFTLGLLDDIVSRCVKLRRLGGERTRRIEFVWCIKSWGQTAWFDTMLSHIASIAAARGSTVEVHVSIYVTCLCDLDVLPIIPCCDVRLGRPSVHSLLCRTVGLPSSPERAEGQPDMLEGPSGIPVCRGGVAVCASGPDSLTAEVQNAVARLGVGGAMEFGGIALHVERFSL